MNTPKDVKPLVGCKALSVSGEKMIEYGLLGEKLGHSFSKDIHEQIADYKYEPLELTLEGLYEFLNDKNFKAVNVTIPYKKAVFPFLDEISDAARNIGAVNCIRNVDGKLIGHNTDFDGLKALVEHLGLDMKGKKVLILGTGGTSDTAKTVCHELDAGEVYKVSRNGGSRKIGSQSGGDLSIKTDSSCSADEGVMATIISYEDAVKFHKDADIIINTTPLGMYPNVNTQAIDLDNFDKIEGIVDVVYNPIRTSLVSQAISKGIKAEGGLYMLVMQAVRASEFFVSTKYDDEVCEAVYKNLLKEKSNIVLTGMPASGKTTVGKLIAKALGTKFIDTDDLIVAKTDMEISDIFAKYGEEYFRNIETEVIKEAALESGVVIATGGGSVLNGQNIFALKQNGVVYFLDRDVEKLIPTEDRPTASNYEQILKRYEERYPIYMETADLVISNNDTPEAAADKILEAFK